jgi:hypothetical protein
MPGIPSRTFELEIAPLIPKALTGVPGDSIAPELKELLVTKRFEALLGKRIVPLGLRWRVTPAMGLPRAPFSMFRRLRKTDDPIDVSIPAAQITSLQIGSGKFRVPSEPLYVLQIRVHNTDPAAAVTVSALDLANRPLPLQTVTVPANTLRHIRFQHPFLGGFSCRGGAFTITSVDGVTMKGWIARDDWELVEVVGLPGNGGEISGYDAQQQGDPSALEAPPVAALRRIEIGQKFYEDLPTSQPSGVTVPLWQIPNPNEELEELRGGTPSLIARLSEMFQATDTGAVPTQAAFRSLEPMPGIRQPEFPGQVTEDAVMNVPLLATVLLNAVTDPWFALSSGFGTTDFPEFLRPSEKLLEPATYFNVSHDYMVASTFTFRSFGSIEFKREHCALSHRSAFPTVQPGQLTAASFGLNRPPRRDDPWSEEISLTWAKINRLQIQGNAVSVAEADLNGAYLNGTRPGNQARKLALFVPAKPGETSDPILHTRNRFFHHGAEIPFIGPRTYHYGVAAMDAFGRWSEWSTVSHNLAPRLPEAPRLMALALTPDTSRIAGNAVPHELSFEVLWDWQDRSPKRFQLAGVFHARHTPPGGTPDNGHVPPANYPTVFQRDNTAAGGPFLELTFPSDVPPATAPVFTATPAVAADATVTVELLPQATNENGQNVEAEMRRYRVRVKDLNVAFEPEDEWFFSLFVKAAEFRNPVLLSDDAPPLPPRRPPRLTTYVPNPIPAPPPVFEPATVLWASLPDAEEVSRFRLAFDRVPTATGGYGIYQAYEAKLRELAGLPVVNGVDLVARATELRDAAMPLGRTADAFTRLNARLVPQPPAGSLVEFEAELSGALDGLFAFAVASVTREQEASPLSTPWLLVAVPRRVVPTAPVLSLAQSPNGTTTLACEFAKTPAPGRVEIVRVRRPFAARDIGTMGPAIHESEPPAWQALDEASRPAASPAVTSRFRFTFVDSTPPSWFPYFYRAVAIGATDVTTGLVAGRSSQSNMVSVENPPKTLPMLDSAEGVQAGPQLVSLRLRSDALIETTPRGSFLLEVHVYDFAHATFGDTPALKVSLALTQPNPGGGLTPGALFASAPDAAGVRAFESVFNVASGPFMLRARLTDPFGRTSERIVSGTVEAIDPPNLDNLGLRRNLRDLLIRFTSTTSPRRPPSGTYRLVISFVVRDAIGLQVKRLLLASLHEIQAGDLNELRNSPVTAILRSATTPSHQPDEYGAVIKRFFPPGPLPVTPIGHVRVTLTAPDDTSVSVETEL